MKMSMHLLSKSLLFRFHFYIPFTIISIIFSSHYILSFYMEYKKLLLKPNFILPITIYIPFSILIKSSLFAHYKSSKKQEKRNHNFNDKNNSSIETELDKSTSSKIQQNNSCTIEKNQNACFC